MSHSKRRKNRVVGVAGASLVLSTGLFGAYLGNPRMPRAYASGGCGYAAVTTDATWHAAIAAFNASGSTCDRIAITADFSMTTTETITRSGPLEITGTGHTVTTGGFHLNVQSGTVTVQDVTFTGGTHYAFNVYPDSDLTLSYVTVSGSHVSQNGVSGTAGAVRVYNGDLHIAHSTFSSNVTDGNGTIAGVIYAQINNTHVVEITSSTFTGNQSNAGVAALGDFGGVLYVKNTGGGGAVSITNSTFYNNSVLQGKGGAIYAKGGYGGGTLSVSGSTFAGNSATGGRGGAIFTGWDTTITNSTFSSNTGTGGAISSYSHDPALTVQFSTFAGNTGYASSIDGSGTTAMTLVGTVFSGNVPTDVDVVGLQALGSPSHSYFDSSDQLYLQGSALDNTNVLGVAGSNDGAASVVGSASLGALASNGGLTQTRLPGAGSSLIGRGGTPGTFTLDQRGTIRLTPTTIGAVQVSAGTSTITYDGNSNTSGSVPSATTGTGSVTLRSNTGSLARTGYTFAGWNTLANGTGTSYAAGATYTLSATVTLCAQWTSTGSGGGGGGGSSSGSTTPSTESTAVVTRRPVVGAVPLGSSSLPTGGVTPGGSLLLVDGVPRAVTVKPDAPVTSQATGLVASGDGFTLRMTGLDAVGAPLGVTGDAALVLERDHSVQVQGSGFDPNSDAQVYVFSQARLLGTVHTDATGAFTGLVQVPGDLELGHHTLQIDALDAGGSVRSLSLGVVVHEPRKSDTQAVARATVMFASGSASLTSQAQRELRALVRATGGRATGGLVVGYVQRDGRFASNAALSAKRASAVARYLQAHGISATLTTRGDGALSPQDTARKAMVTLRYPT